MDTSSRTSVALVEVLCARYFGIRPTLESHQPDASAMLARCDAALIIGDAALLLDADSIDVRGAPQAVQKIDLGETWAEMTGLPFVYAFWAGRLGALDEDDIVLLQRARDAGVTQPDLIAREYFADAPERQTVGARYLRDNIKYHLRDDERAGLETFFHYAAEAGVVAAASSLNFY